MNEMIGNMIGELPTLENMLKSNLNCFLYFYLFKTLFELIQPKTTHSNQLPSQPSMDPNSGQDSIQVYIRIKPNTQQQGILAFTETQIKLDKHQFAFDKIFPPSATQNDIFHHVGNKLLNNVLDGYNSCVFVYGQTGSGKTHTMIGENNGLMQQSFNQLFARINRIKNAECLVTCSYFELYNQQIMDLLEPKKQKKLNIRQDAKKGVFIENLSEQTALDCHKLMEVLYTGMKNRHIGETQMNRQSSRSHSVFTISLSCKMEQDGKKILKTPKLHFVDLAGSQRQKMTQASGDRLKQASNINKSLTTLGMVINALTSEKPRNHIPYRDSKLTCLLRDSLGGNSKTIIIAAVSSIALSFQETLSTLNFANRAKMVKVKALINEESLSSNIEVFKEEIRRLKMEIMRLKSEQHRTPIKVITHEFLSPKQIGNELEQHFEEINKKINAISEQLSNGIVSPSLEMLLSNINGKKGVGSSETMMEDQNLQMEGSMGKCTPSEFIEYLNSNYELLSQINTKISEYVQLKDELRHAAVNKKLTIERMLTPSKFERDQYEELLMRREKEIKQLQQKVQELQTSINLRRLQKKELERKVQQHLWSKTDSTQELERLRQYLIERELELQREKGEGQKLKSQLMRSQKSQSQLERRLKQTKQLHVYAQEKYQNQRMTSMKLNLKLQESQKQVHRQKKLLQNAKEQKAQVQNELENFKMLLQDRQCQEQQMKNSLSQFQQTLEFNKKIIQNLTNKTQNLNNQLQHSQQTLQQLTTKNLQLHKQNQQLHQQNLQLHQQNQLQKQNLEQKTIQLTRQLEQKSFQLQQSQITHQTLAQQLSLLSNQLLAQKQTKQSEFRKHLTQISQLKTLLNLKQSQIMNTLTQMHLLQDSLNKILSEHQTSILNYSMKYEAKLIQSNNLQLKLNEYTSQSQALIQQLKNNNQTHLSKIQTLASQNFKITQQNHKLTQQNQQIQTKLAEANQKISQIQHIYDQNQQFKKTYKELVKQNYRLKGKYQNLNQNQELEKQKNDELLSKVQFYQEKFKLMSIEYHQIQAIVKKLKEKQLQSNKKIQFYQQNLKLIHIQKSTSDSQQINQLIRQLKDQNRQLKYKLDTLQGNLIQSSQKLPQNDSGNKKFKDQRQSMSLSVKYEKFRGKLALLMKNWQGFANKSQQQVSTEEMIDLCEVMLNQNGIKFETIAKGIRREQKLKSQNHFILKENIYLKERVEKLQKSQGIHDKSELKPRKVVKLE